MIKNSKNPEYRRIITGKRWGKLRALKMLLNGINNGGFCEECVRNYRKGGQRPRKATEVHHIKPIESAHTRAEMEALAYDEANLMALCSECHHEIHKRLWESHRRLGKVQRKLRKAALREKIDKDIEDYINNIKNGI